MNTDAQMNPAQNFKPKYPIKTRRTRKIGYKGTEAEEDMPCRTCSRTITKGEWCFSTFEYFGSNGQYYDNNVKELNKEAHCKYCIVRAVFNLGTSEETEEKVNNILSLLELEK